MAMWKVAARKREGRRWDFHGGGLPPQSYTTPVKHALLGQLVPRWRRFEPDELYLLDHKLHGSAKLAINRKQSFLLVFFIRFHQTAFWDMCIAPVACLGTISWARCHSAIPSFSSQKQASDLPMTSFYSTRMCLATILRA
jgi:hypothetical protein